MSRYTPTVAEAEGMLGGLASTHTCTTACTGVTTLGDGKRLQRKCPLTLLDLTNPADRRIIGGLYAAEARAAMGVTA